MFGLVTCGAQQVDCIVAGPIMSVKWARSPRPMGLFGLVGRGQQRIEAREMICCRLLPPTGSTTTATVVALPLLASRKGESWVV